MSDGVHVSGDLPASLEDLACSFNFKAGVNRIGKIAGMTIYDGFDLTSLPATMNMLPYNYVSDKYSDLHDEWVGHFDAARIRDGFDVLALDQSRLVSVPLHLTLDFADELIAPYRRTRNAVVPVNSAYGNISQVQSLTAFQAIMYRSRAAIGKLDSPLLLERLDYLYGTADNPVQVAAFSLVIDQNDEGFTSVASLLDIDPRALEQTLKNAKTSTIVMPDILRDILVVEGSGVGRVVKPACFRLAVYDDFSYESELQFVMPTNIPILYTAIGVNVVRNTEARNLQLSFSSHAKQMPFYRTMAGTFDTTTDGQVDGFSLLNIK
jgi:hypothetical protein